jgi:hypothetical protein
MPQPWSILLLPLILAACSGPPSPGPDPGNKPTITRFTATPDTLAAPGPVTLAWEVTGATTLEIGGLGSVTPPTAGSRSVNLGTTTTYTLTARNAAGSATAQVTARLSARPFAFEIDPTIHPDPDTTGDGRGGTLPLAASKDEQGVRSEFIANQVLIVPRNQAELDGFLARTGGTVVEDDTIPAPPAELGITLTDAQRKATTYTVRLDPSAFPLNTFGADAAAAGLEGKAVLSSETAARLMALSVREVAAGRAVGLNYFDRPDAVMLRTEERPDGAGGFSDAFATTRFGATGSRSNVVGAWQWLRAKGLVRRVRVAILDGGFWVNGGGQPNSVAGIGSDLPANPIQYDFVNNDNRVGDPNPGSCSGGSSCPWHGNSAAGVATGLLNNRAGAAGTGGMVADPMLFHIATTKGQQKWALSTARAWGADVINMSFGGACNYWCRQEENVLGYDKEIERVRNAGIVMVASAGNSTENVDSEYVHPCNYDGVICVGALNDDANTPQGYSSYGGSVDLWAPTNLPVMPHGANMAVHSYGGTSASAPFVAGIAAMMKAVNPGLTGDQVRDLLRDTAWTDSPDSKVSHAVNALAAVKRASNNELPPDRFESNNSADNARPLGAGQHDDLSVHQSGNSDYYRLTSGGASVLTLNFTSPDNLGKLGFGYGLLRDVGCGWQEEVRNAAGANTRQLVYRVPAGVYTLGLGSSQPLPYDLGVKLEGVSILPDGYEPNNTLGTARSLSDGRPLNATLHAGDLDFYGMYSFGSMLPSAGGINGYESLVEVRAADSPVTLTVYNAAGEVVGSSTSSPDCKKLAKVGNLPNGFLRFSVSSAVPGNYALFAGQRWVLGRPLNDIDSMWRLLLNPGDPIEFVVREPVEWAALTFNQDGIPTALDLRTPGLHLALFNADGQQVGQGVAADFQATSGETLDLRQTASGTQYYLRIERTASSEASAEVGAEQLPAITARLNLR